MTRRRRITIEASEEDVGALRSIAGFFDALTEGPELPRTRDLASRIEAALREEDE